MLTVLLNATVSSALICPLSKVDFSATIEFGYKLEADIVLAVWSVHTKYYLKRRCDTHNAVTPDMSCFDDVTRLFSFE